MTILTLEEKPLQIMPSEKTVYLPGWSIAPVIKPDLMPVGEEDKGGAFVYDLDTLCIILRLTFASERVVRFSFGFDDR